MIELSVVWCRILYVVLLPYPIVFFCVYVLIVFAFDCDLCKFLLVQCVFLVFCVDCRLCFDVAFYSLIVCLLCLVLLLLLTSHNICGCVL